jgi:hypothetical protein
MRFNLTVVMRITYYCRRTRMCQAEAVSSTEHVADDQHCLSEVEFRTAWQALTFGVPRELFPSCNDDSSKVRFSWPSQEFLVSTDNRAQCMAIFHLGLSKIRLVGQYPRHACRQKVDR